ARTHDLGTRRARSDRVPHRRSHAGPPAQGLRARARARGRAQPPRPVRARRAAGGDDQAPVGARRRRRRRGGGGGPQGARREARRHGAHQPRDQRRHLRVLPGGRGPAVRELRDPRRAPPRDARRVRGGAGDQRAARAPLGADRGGGRLLARHAHRVAHGGVARARGARRPRADLGDRRRGGDPGAADRQDARGHRVGHVVERREARVGDGAGGRRRVQPHAGGRGRRGARAHGQARRRRGDRQRGPGDVGAVAPRVRQARAPRDLRRHLGRDRADRRPPPLLEPVDDHGLDDGHAGRVQHHRRVLRERAARAPGRLGVPARGRARRVRAPLVGAAVRQDRHQGV
ncbi:MAG: Alcohol dehydrogenase, partial [uncultured Gemmatimonadaceae bacterium]